MSEIESSHEGWDIRELWEKHEDIAMHFNDLIMRIRTQALGVVAALAALVGIFAKETPSDIQNSWEIATLVFAGLALFWVAIACLDLGYYNKLLSGAVAELRTLEDASVTNKRLSSIRLSSTIENVVQGQRPHPRTWGKYVVARWGICAFYTIVFFSLLGGALISQHERDESQGLGSSDHISGSVLIDGKLDN